MRYKIREKTEYIKSGVNKFSYIDHTFQMSLHSVKWLVASQDYELCRLIGLSRHVKRIFAFLYFYFASSGTICAACSITF